MAVEQAAEVREVRRPHQGVEREVQRGERPEPRGQRGPEHPVHVGDVVEHRPEPAEAGVTGEFGHDVGGLRRVEGCPAHDARDEGRARRQLQQEPGLGHRGRGLNEDGSDRCRPGRAGARGPPARSPGRSARAPASASRSRPGRGARSAGARRCAGAGGPSSWRGRVGADEALGLEVTPERGGDRVAQEAKVRLHLVGGPRAGDHRSDGGVVEGKLERGGGERDAVGGHHALQGADPLEHAAAAPARSCTSRPVARRWRGFPSCTARPR